jgi:hypothetical protein
MYPPPPPRNGYGPFSILAVCHHNLRPAMSRSENREPRGPIVASDQGSSRGHHRSETVLTGETRFHYESGFISETRTADPLDGKQTVDPLDQ